MNQWWGNAEPPLQTLDLRQRLLLAGRQLLFVNNKYAYLLIGANQRLQEIKSINN